MYRNEWGTTLHSQKLKHLIFRNGGSTQYDGHARRGPILFLLPSHTNKFSLSGNQIAGLQRAQLPVNKTKRTAEATLIFFSS